LQLKKFKNIQLLAENPSQKWQEPLPAIWDHRPSATGHKWTYSGHLNLSQTNRYS